MRCRNPELVCLSPASISRLVARLTRAILNARNEHALAPAAEARIEDAQCYHGPLDWLEVPSAPLLLSSGPAATRLPAPILMVTAEDDMFLFHFQLPKLRGYSDDSRNENTADAIILKWLAV